MKLSDKKIKYMAKRFLKETEKKLKEIDNVEPGDTLRVTYKIVLTTCINKEDVI